MKHPIRILPLLLCLPLLAMAQTEQDDAAFDEALRNFGFTAGATLQCADTAERPRVEADALKAHSGIVRLFGSDSAFLYAAAFGAGSVMTIERDKCAEYQAAFGKAMQKHATR